MIQSRSGVIDAFSVSSQGLIYVLASPDVQLDEEWARRVVDECDGTLLRFGEADVWEELKASHVGEDSSLSANVAKRNTASSLSD